MSSENGWPGDRGGHLWPKDREAVRDDGARIRYTVRGPQGAPHVVLCAGYLCPDNFWTYLAPALVEHYRVVMLNYRGVGASTLPRDPGWLGHRLRSDEYRMSVLAGDVGAVLDAEDVDRAALVGHSMGCQVALEVFRQRPDQISALVHVTGPFRSPFRTFYGTRLMAWLFPLLYLGAKVSPEPMVRLIPKLARAPRMLDVAQLARAIGAHTPRGPMQIYLDHFAELDAGVAFRVAKGMHHHDATDLLSEVTEPSLVVVGRDDTFSPPSLGEEFAGRLPDSELVELDDATHCALLEHPERVNGLVLDFLQRRLG